MKIKIMNYGTWSDQVCYCHQIKIGKMRFEGTETYGRKSDARRGARRLIQQFHRAFHSQKMVEVEG